MREMLAIKESANKIKGYNQLERGKKLFTKKNAEHFYVLPPVWRVDSSVPSGTRSRTKVLCDQRGIGAQLQQAKMDIQP